MEKHRNMEENILTAKCTVCGQPLEEEWKYCPYCMHEKEIERCLFCNKEINPAWGYCPYCKKELKTIRNTARKFEDSNDWLRNVLSKK